MNEPKAALVQRLIAAEFERRGWEYDLNVGRQLAEAIEVGSHRDASSLAKLVPRDFLAKARASRSEVTAAVTRVLELEAQSQRGMLRPASGMRVLFVAAGPEDEARLRLDAEHRDIRNRIRSSTGREQVVLEAALAARPADLIDELNRLRPTILHLAGHGGPTGIALEDENGHAVDVTTDQLSHLVASADPALRVVVLNSCESSRQAAPLVEYVDSAIGMTREIGDDAARVFAAQLYSSMAEGVALPRAFEQARLQVNLVGLDEDQTPRLFTRRGISGDDLVFVS